MDEQHEVFEAPLPDPVVVRDIVQCYRGKSTINTTVAVTDLGRKIRDFDGKELNLYECIYKVGSVESRRLIQRGNPSDVSLVSSYAFISCFRHPAAVQVENYIKSESLVISLVNGTFTRWLEMQSYNDLFTPEGTMRPLIRDMIIELASLVESLLAKGMYPTDLTQKNMYIKILPDGTPRLQVLITDVKKIVGTGHSLGAWESVRKIVGECFASHHFVPNDATKGFCSFIGIPRKNIGVLLKDFPDQWDASRKGTFLMESCANSTQVSVRINYKSDLKWPRTADGSSYPLLLLQLLTHGRKKSNYDVNFPNDYMKLCRNGYKHFDEVPDWLKANLGGSKAGLLRQIEEWSPNIWSILYAAINA